MYAPFWQNAEAYGIEKDGVLICAIELCMETWSNRLRVTEMWVDANHRRLGLASKLMDLAKQKAKEKKGEITVFRDAN